MRWPTRPCSPAPASARSGCRPRAIASAFRTSKAPSGTSSGSRRERRPAGRPGRRGRPRRPRLRPPPARGGRERAGPRGLGRRRRPRAHRRGRRLPPRPGLPGAAHRLPGNPPCSRLRGPRPPAVPPGRARPALGPLPRALRPVAKARARVAVAHRGRGLSRRPPAHGAVPGARAARLARGSLPAARVVRDREAARRGLLGRDDRRLLPALLRRDPARPVARRLEPDARVRLPDDGRGGRRHSRRGNGCHPGADGEAPPGGDGPARRPRRHRLPARGAPRVGRDDRRRRGGDRDRGPRGRATRRAFRRPARAP